MNNNCQHCNASFEIDAEELAFIDKVSPTFSEKKYPFPEPKNCPKCRVILRTLHRNEKNIYSNNSSIDNKPLISIYSSDKPYKILPQNVWFSDVWDPLDHGRDFDFSRPFFEQFLEIQTNVPRANMMTSNNENSEFTTGTAFCKNCYLINSSEHCEDCLYSKLLQNCKNVIDCSYAYNSELLYECFNVRQCYNCEYVYNSQNSHDCSFCDDLSGCSNCFLSTNLRQKEYYFMNEPLSKDKYKEKVKEYTDYQNIQKALDQFKSLIQKRFYKYSNIINCENVSGDFIRDSKNCQNCYDLIDSEDCKNVHVGIKCKDIWDCSNMYEGPELSYQVLGTISTYNVHYCVYVFESSDMYYCDTCYSCSNCFGSTGLKNKKYCIFNKQYTKEEYEKLVPKIIEHMQSTSEWGEFFPASLSPFAYNETLAHEYFPMTEDEVSDKGWEWKEKEDKIPDVEKIIPAEKLPDDISEIPDDILNWAIKCEKTNRPFKIQKMELEFYRKMDIPVPHLHPDVRYETRMAKRNSRKLWDRNCADCNAKVKTTYAPERPEKVFCEECYLKEIN